MSTSNQSEILNQRALCKRPELSVIIPTLNESDHISITLEQLLICPGSFEIIVVDGQSKDDTVSKVQTFNRVKVIESSVRGRADQMNEGARAAKADHLFFLHADTIPPPNFAHLIRKTLSPDIAQAGSFFIRFDDQSLKYQMLSALTRLNFKLTTFGDQGLFIAKGLFEQLNGFASIPILEDLEFQDRIRRKVRFRKIPIPLITSARRFKRNGFAKQVFIDTAILLGYRLGIPPKVIHQWYL